MSTGLKGPPLVRVSAAPISSGVLDSNAGLNMNSGKFTHVKNEGSSEKQIMSQAHNDDIKVNAMGAASIGNNMAPMADFSAPTTPHHATVSSVSSISSINSTSSRNALGVINNSNGFGGPPPPMHSNNPSRLSSNQAPPTGQFGGPLPPPSYRGLVPPDTLKHAPPPRSTVAPQHAPPSRNPISPQPVSQVAPPKRSGRIDASQIPRPPRPQKDIVYNTRSGTGFKVPPLSGAIYKAVDNGNCSPRLMRISTCAVPTTKEVLGHTGIPMAMIVTPFAGPENGEEQVHLVDMGESPPRCQRCGGYVNPSVSWSDGGNKWGCNLCGAVNSTPAWYFSSLDGAGLRLDRQSRPELSRGAADFIVSEAYCKRPPQVPIFLFVVDISQKAVMEGTSEATLKSIKNLINEALFQGGGVRVGIITFNENVNFYDIRPNARDPVKILIVNPDDCFAPIPLSNMLFSPVLTGQSVNCLILLLDELLNQVEMQNIWYTDNKAYPSCQHSCSLAALKAAQVCLAKTGGRIVMMSSSALSSARGQPIEGGRGQQGTYAIKERERLSCYGTDEELALYCSLRTAVTLSAALSGTDKQGKVEADRKKEREILEESIELADACCASSISVDVFIFAEDRLLSDRQKKDTVDLTFRDVSIMAESSDQTGGHVHYFTGNMRFDDNIIRLGDEVAHLITQTFVAEAVVKLRSSSGFKLQNYFGMGKYHPIEGEVELQMLDADTCMCFTVRHDTSAKTVKDEEKVYFQLAILHTDVQQRKIVRVLNLSVTASKDPAVVFRHSDYDTVVATIAKIAVDRAFRLPLSILPNTPLTGGAGLGDNVCVRDWLVDTVIEILKQYRIHCSPQSPSGMLILPESLKLLPLHTLAILKHPAFAENVALSKKLTGGPLTEQNVRTLTVRASERAFELRRLRSLPIQALLCALYPRFCSMRSMTDGEMSAEKLERIHSGSPKNNRNISLYLSTLSQSPTNSGNDSPLPPKNILLPPTASGMLGPKSLISYLPSPLAVTAEALESDGIYLLDDGSVIFLIVGKNVPYDWLECVIESVDCPLYGPEKPQKIQFLTGEKSFGGVLGGVAGNLERVVGLSRRMSPFKQELRVVWADEYSNPDALRMGMRLVEDSVHGVSSYVDFLCKLHSIVSSKIK